jgi:threonyl-tRNA synthetase
MAEELSLLEKKRHSAAHLLAIAVLDQFPDAKLGIGPTIENGFYYDFETISPITPEHLPKLEEKMRELIKASLGFDRTELSTEEAKQFFKEQPYKVELITDLAKEGNETVSLYKTGEFTDLCRGGHVEMTDLINAKGLKLTKIAGAYWRGDENRPMLQRIYGVLFDTKDELEAYLAKIEEAEKRDHRKLGKELDLFVFSDLVGAGLPLFTPKGTIVRNELGKFINELRAPLGYEQVLIPHIAKSDLYKTSGHWDKFKDDLFHVSGKSGEAFVMKPMNCPHHNQIYLSQPRSYRQLPIRYSEITTNYRDEQTGELHGLSRVRSLTQDDSHVYCRPDQVKDEVTKIYGMIHKVYETIDMPLKIRLSLRDPEHKENYLGEDAVWEKAESELRELLAEMSEESYIGVGEAAFYGPKLDFMATDAIGREWQVSTIQLDFNQPERFKMTYADSDGSEKQPVMIHCAILGSVERFMSVAIEHFAGAFPTWLAPVQVQIVPVSDKFNIYATDHIMKPLEAAGIRVEIDEANESVGKKIRNATLQKVPYTVVIGEKEIESGQLAVRSRDKGDLPGLALESFIDELKREIIERTR